MNQSESLSELARIKTAYQNFIRDNFEFAAEDCQTCPTQGVCCTDAHFVNVHITRLEAAAILETLENLSEDEKQAVYLRAAEAIEKYDLKARGDTFAQTFTCPLFVPKIGCLVHGEAKPVPCIQHACYENKEDLPPQCLQDRAEQRIEKLNKEAYGDDWQWLPLPLWLAKINENSPDLIRNRKEHSR
ncbi:MAG TPA: hypothetical protein VEX64_05175 [Pyrinomonadaceae bacterium]|nr:hypothetical protein [Pyrinomonadaceae bacterium]